jgi:hypothetical protein
MLLSRKDALKHFMVSLKENNGILSRTKLGSRILEIDQDSIKINFVPDLCREMQCGGKCIYENQYNNFKCTCPKNFYLNVDGISCVMKQNNIDSNKDHGNEILEKVIERMKQGQPSVPKNEPTTISSRDLVEEEHPYSLLTTTMKIVVLKEDENITPNITKNDLIEEIYKLLPNIQQVTTPISSITYSSSTTPASSKNIPEITTETETTTTTDYTTSIVSSTTTNPVTKNTTSAVGALPTVNPAPRNDKPEIERITEKDNADDSINIVTMPSTSAQQEEIELTDNIIQNDTLKTNTAIPIFTEEGNTILKPPLSTHKSFICYIMCRQRGFQNSIALFRKNRNGRICF